MNGAIKAAVIIPTIKNINTLRSAVISLSLLRSFRIPTESNVISLEHAPILQKYKKVLLFQNNYLISPCIRGETVDPDRGLNK